MLADPDDDHVLACALGAKADLIVSGDSDLLNLKTYRGSRSSAPPRRSRACRSARPRASSPWCSLPAEAALGHARAQEQQE